MNTSSGEFMYQTKLLLLLFIELAERNTPELRPPLKLLATAKDNFIEHRRQDPSTCSFGSCFDLSRCPLSSGFPVYFYNNLYRLGFFQIFSE